MRHYLKRRGWAIASLLIVVPSGVYSKLYSGPAANWVNNSLSGVFYELFWCILANLLFDRAQPWAIAASVLAVTCVLEFLQLWHPPFLELIRSSTLGRTLLGTSFTWLDFPYYVLGCGVGWVWLRRLRALESERGTESLGS